MIKRITALTVIFVMLVLVFPTAQGKSNDPSLTIDDILIEYQKEAFALSRISVPTASANTYVLQQSQTEQAITGNLDFYSENPDDSNSLNWGYHNNPLFSHDDPILLQP